MRTLLPVGVRGGWPLVVGTDGAGMRVRNVYRENVPHEQIVHTESLGDTSYPSESLRKSPPTDGGVMLTV
jgi:hypothetical protein